MPVEDLRFERQYRTPHSEGYLMFEASDRLGRIELHFTPSVVYGTMLIEREMEEDDILDVIEQADDELVMTADVPRESDKLLSNDLTCERVAASCFVPDSFSWTLSSVG